MGIISRLVNEFSHFFSCGRKKLKAFLRLIEYLGESLLILIPKDVNFPISLMVGLECFDISDRLHNFGLEKLEGLLYLDVMLFKGLYRVAGKIISQQTFIKTLVDELLVCRIYWQLFRNIFFLFMIIFLFVYKRQFSLFFTIS